MHRALPFLLVLGGCHLVLPHRAAEERARDSQSREASSEAGRREQNDGPALERSRQDAPTPDVPRLDAPRPNGDARADTAPPDLVGPDLKAKKDLLIEPTCTCPANLVCCLETGPCVDTQTDAKHCGGCHNACAAGQTCEKGICVCNASSCTGCCDPNGMCVTGSNPGLCSPGGIAGAACGVCPAPPTCQTALCLGGRCATAAKPDGAACDDLDLCTLSDHCKNGSCTSTTTKTCTLPPIPCKIGGCIPATGQCGYTNAKAGASCTLDCVVGAACDGSGNCVGGAAAVDGTPCSIGTCCAGSCCAFSCCPSAGGATCKSTCN